MYLDICTYKNKNKEKNVSAMSNIQIICRLELGLPKVD